MYFLLGGAVLLTCGVWLFAASRCYGLHDPMVSQKRDETGRTVKPHALIWICRECGRVVGETQIETKWKLVAQNRRQAVSQAMERRRA